MEQPREDVSDLGTVECLFACSDECLAKMREEHKDSAYYVEGPYIARAEDEAYPPCDASGGECTALSYNFGVAMPPEDDPAARLRAATA